jgi:hypothetical protein
MNLLADNLLRIETWWFAVPILTLIWLSFRPQYLQYRALVWVAGLQVFSWLIVEGFRWYRWSHDALLQYYVPPKGVYFFQQVTRHGVTLLAALLVAGVVYWLCDLIFIRRGKELMLDRRDVLLLTLATAGIGWPGVFIYFFIVLALSVVWMIAQIIARRKSMSDRLIITPMIAPAALITFAFKTSLLLGTYLYKIQF